MLNSWTKQKERNFHKDATRRSFDFCSFAKPVKKLLILFNLYTNKQGRETKFYFIEKLLLNSRLLCSRTFLFINFGFEVKLSVLIFFVNKLISSGDFLTSLTSFKVFQVSHVVSRLICSKKMCTTQKSKLNCSWIFHIVIWKVKIKILKKGSEQNVSFGTWNKL